MLVALLTSLSERRREMAILRSVGAGPRHVMALLLLEALGLALLGTLLGVALLQLGLLLLSPWLQANYGILVAPAWPTVAEWKLLALVLGAALLVALIPAALAYRRSVADGMSVRN
jgi:putative ABC transport system permease protein